MDGEGSEALRKRMKTTEGMVGEGGAAEGDGEEEAETNVAGSEEMEMNIQRIHERIEDFTRQVSELLEAGKTLFKDLSTEFEDRLISIHREQIEKWQEEIKELRMVDASNEATQALLQNAQYHMLQNVREHS